MIQKFEILYFIKTNGIIARIGVLNCHLKMYFNNFFIKLNIFFKDTPNKTTEQKYILIN